MTEPEQMTFDQVVDMEPVSGDPAYTEWLASKITWDEYMTLHGKRYRPVKDVVTDL